MAIASGSSAESQHESALVVATSEASVSTEQQQMTPTPGTGELLNRVVTEFSQAFQSSLVQAVSDIRRDYGVDVEPDSNFAWMEKGGAGVAPDDEQLPRNDDDDGDSDSDDVHRILRELQLSRLQVRQLQQVVDGLREEQRLSAQRVALFGTLSAKLKRDLVDERLALIDAKNEIKELQRRRSRDDTGSGGGGGRSPQSPLLQEQSDNLWNSPNKPIGGSAGGASGSGTTGDGPEGPNLMGFNFYPSASSRGAGGQEGANDDDSPSTSSSTQTLRSTLIGQFLPSALLDSPQFTPKHARPFAVDALNEEKVSPSMFQLKDEIESLSLTAPRPVASPTCSTVNQQYTYDGTGDETKETSQGDSGRVSMLSAVSPLKVSMLSELFDAIPIEELEMILRRFDGVESAAIDNILSSHPSFNPAVGDGGRVESGASMALPSPSRSSSVGHSKTSSHRSSQSGPSGPPSGSSSNWKTEICMYYMQGKCNKTRRTCSFAHGESDLVRPSGSSLGGSISKHGPTYKTRLCQSYENGTCTKPRRDCTMAHGVNDLRDGASASGGGGGSQPILPPAAPRLQSYKTELCYYFLKGNCNYSREECRFAHGQNDMRTVESNTAQIAAASSNSGFGGDFGPTSPVPPPPAVSMEKQLQLQHQYQQQYQQHHQPSSMTSFQPQPPPPAQQQSFVPQHQIQLQHSSRGAGGAGHHQFGFQPQQYDLAQQQQQYMPPPGQYRYLRNMEDKRLMSAGRPPRRDSGSSWSSFDASGLPPSEY